MQTLYYINCVLDRNKLVVIWDLDQCIHLEIIEYLIALSSHLVQKLLVVAHAPKNGSIDNPNRPSKSCYFFHDIFVSICALLV